MPLTKKQFKELKALTDKEPWRRTSWLVQIRSGRFGIINDKIQLIH